MKTQEVALPDRLAKQVKELVEPDWFLNGRSVGSSSSRGKPPEVIQ